MIPGRFKVIETDGMTGWERYLDNMSPGEWTGTFTRERAEATVKWREENIVSRYSYRVVPVEPHMTDNDAARERHDARHWTRRMDGCSDIDCLEAARRLRREEASRRFAQAHSDGRKG